jgi:hypothetical protein
VLETRRAAKEEEAKKAKRAISSEGALAMKGERSE